MNIEEAIALLTKDLDAETVSTLLDLFLTDTPEQITGMREALVQGDLPTLGRLAHSIAGSSSTFGLRELRAMALHLEETALAGDVPSLSIQIEALATAYEQAVPELKRIIQQ